MVVIEYSVDVHAQRICGPSETQAVHLGGFPRPRIQLQMRPAVQTKRHRPRVCPRLSLESYKGDAVETVRTCGLYTRGTAG